MSPPRPRVLMVAHWDWVLAHFRLPIARGLRDAGAEVVFVCPEGEHVAQLRAEGFRWVAWPIDRRGLAPHRELGALVRLARIFRRERPALVQHYTIKPCLYGSLAARVVPSTTVVNVFSGLGFVFGDDRRAGRLRRALLPLLSWALRRPRAWSFTLTESDRRRLQEACRLPADRTGVLPEGIDVDRFRPPERAVVREVPVVLLACRLLYDKGVGDLVEATRRLGDRGVSLRVRIVGEPDPGNPGAIPDHVLRGWADGHPQVELLGRRDDVDALLRDADVAVLPTRYGEGVPWFLLEAAASELPLVATDIPGCRAMVDDGVTGRLVPVGDVDALADALQGLLEDPGRRARYGRAGRALVERDFSERTVQRAHVQLLTELGVLTPGPHTASRLH